MITTKYGSWQWEEFMAEPHQFCGGKFIQKNDWWPVDAHTTATHHLQKCEKCGEIRYVETDAGTKIKIFNNDVPSVQNVRITENGLRTHIKGERYARKGFPEFSLVEYALPAIKAIIPMVTGYGAKLARKLHISPERYQKSVKEIYRVMTLASSRSTDQKMKEKIENVRDTICPVLELDDFYLNIFQDMVSEIRIEELLPDEVDKHFREEQRGQYNFGGK